MRESLLDTDILSEIMEGKNPSIVAKAKQYYRAFGRYTVSAVTYAELLAGISYNPLPKYLKGLGLLDPLLEVLPIEREEAATAGRLVGLMKRKGMQIGILDPFIAAIAIEQNLILVTGNSAHFQVVIDLGFPLEIENWRN